MAYLSNENAIPLMTSNTTPSGVVSASSTFSVGNEWVAFTNNSSDWRTANGHVEDWIRYDFPRKVCIGKYSIVPGSTITANPKMWLFEGSNDGINWTILDSKGNQTSWASSADYTIPNRVSYSKYRLNIGQNNGYATFTSLRQVMMYEYVFENKFLISSNDNNYYSINSSDPYLNLIPAMTSDTTPQGVASTSSVMGSNVAYKAFDNLFTGNGWIADSGNLTDQWLAYQFVKPTILNKYTITVTYEKSTAPKDWFLQGSNDGLNWDVLDTRTGQIDWIISTKREYGFPNNQPYRIYRIFVTSNNGSLYYVHIGEMEMMEDRTSLIVIGNSTPTEKDYLRNGISMGTTIDFNKDMTNTSFVISNSTSLGTGRVFKKSIDTQKMTIKNLKTE
ncbi:discoidin domain-containing protein [Paenibacillus glucanolyticus]